MSELLDNITADMVKKSLDIVALEHKLHYQQHCQYQQPRSSKPAC